MTENVPERLATGEFVIRASALSGWNDCPRRSAARSYRGLLYQAGYTLVGVGRHIGAVVGSAVHESARTLLSEKLIHGILPPESVSDDAAAEAVRVEGRAGVVYDDTTRTLNVAEQQAIRAARSYYRTIAPHVEPLAVEERFWMPLSARFVLTGQPDVAEHLRVRDLKAGARKRAAGPQYGAYSLGRRFLGFDTEAIIEDWTGRVRLDKAQPAAEAIPYDVAIAERQAVEVANQVMAQTDRFLREGDPYAYPSNPNSQLCSPKFCPAWGTTFCRDHAGATE